MSDTPQAPKEAGFFTAIRGWGITRGPNGVLGGVVEGVGARIGLAAVPARILVVVAAILLNGLVLLAYAAAWGLLPDRNGNIIIQNFGRGVTNVGALIGIGIFTLFGLGGLNNGVLTGAWRGIDPFPWDGGPRFGGDVPNIVGFVVSAFAVLVAVAVIAGVVVLIVHLARGSNRPPSGPDAPQRPTAGTEPTPPPGTPNTGVWAVPPQRAAAATTGAAAGATSAAASRSTGASSSTPAPGTSATSADAAGEGTAASAPGATTPGARSYYTPPAEGYYTPPVPPMPPVLPQPRVPGPGRVGYLAALAWLFLSVAGVLIADRVGALDVHSGVAWFVVYVLGLGVIVAGVGLAGRKMGFLGFVATVGALMLTLSIAADDEWDDSFSVDEGLVSIEVDGEDVREVSLFGETLVFDIVDYFPDRDASSNGWCTVIDDGDHLPTASTAISDVRTGESVAIDAGVTEVTLAGGTAYGFTSSDLNPADVILVEQGLRCHGVTALSIGDVADNPVVLDAYAADDHVTLIIKEAA